MKKNRLLINEEVIFLSYPKDNVTSKSISPSLPLTAKDWHPIGLRGIINGISSSITPIMPIAYPLCPWELAILDNEFFENSFLSETAKSSSPKWIKINNMFISEADLEAYFIKYRKYSIEESNSDAYMLLRKVLAEQEKIIFTERVKNIKIDSAQFSKYIDEFCTANNIKLINLYEFGMSEAELKDKILNDPVIMFKFKVSQYIKQHHKDYKEISVSDEEIQKFYNNYKPIFIEYINKNSKHKQTDLVTGYIREEIKRLKYYNLEELINNHPKLELK